MEYVTCGMAMKIWRSSMKNCLLFGVFLFSCSFFVGKAHGKEAILLDTRTALSDLGWTMSPGSEWQEMSGSDKDDNEIRMLTVCQIRKPKQNNWMRTQYIPVQGARRIYIDVEFTIRSCEDVQNVATCKETFNLYYYETDRDEATTTFPPWREGAYVKVDTIAADQRFQPGSSETNFETRDIGPITKNGIYLSVQDTGGCVALMHVRVYYKYCDKATESLATFTRTTAGPELTSLVETKGSCVRNAITENTVRPSLYCNGEGEWTVPSGTCVCTAGYEPNHALTQCRACRPGYFKSTVANRSCKRCPDYSLSKSQGATLCDCMVGYFRSHSDDADDQCTKPPTKPVNAYSQVNETSVALKWSQPLNTGGRDDLAYRVQCQRCEVVFKNCHPCSSSVQYKPDQTGLRTTSAVVSALSSFAYYKFKVCAYNGVADVAKSSGQLKDDCVEVRVETNQAAPSFVVGVYISGVTDHSFVVTWNPPLTMNGLIQEYEVAVETMTSPGRLPNEDLVTRNRTEGRRLTISGLESGTEYSVKVRARTAAGIGPYSAPKRVQTTSTPVKISTPSEEKEVTPSKGIDTMLIAAICGGAVLVFVIIAALLCFRRRRVKRSRLRKKGAEKLPAVYNGSSVKFNRTFTPGHKTYIDPTTYEDPNRAVREFTKEIDTLYVKIEEVIGGGEFGEVCRGRLHLPNKPEQDIAIKTLKTGYSTQQKLDFLGEASIMGQFEHPNVIRLEGVVTRSRPLMIITEYMENGSLDAFLRNHDNEFTVIQLVGMLRNIAAGMKYLSDMGYVHRDLAARNILVNAQLVCKVSDFGMSRVLEEDSDAAYTARGGKIPIRWTAPEAFTFRKFTSASDVWSYGIVMWEVMSYGERPYWGMSNRDVMNAVDSGYRLPAPMDCPEVQHRLMLECWKKDRNQRPKFGQIVSSLDKVLRDPSQLKAKVRNERNINGPNGTNGTPVRPASAIPTGSAHITTPLARTSSTPPVPSATTDSGINEDTDEDSPMLRGAETDLKPLHQAGFSSLGVWLESIGFIQYKENFMRNGCSSLEQVIQLNSSDLTRMGIVNEEHQVSLLNSIQEIPPPNGHRQQPGLPTYTESMMMPTGISV